MEKEKIKDIADNLDFGMRCDYREIKGMDSHESFRVMEDFADSVDNEQVRDRLLDALNRPKPFRNFKFTIDGSGEYRDKWFRFKEHRLLMWVESQIQEHKL